MDNVEAETAATTNTQDILADLAFSEEGTGTVVIKKKVFESAAATKKKGKRK